MSLSYTTVTVIGPDVAGRFATDSLPALPFAYFATVPDARGCVVLFPETVRDVPNAGDFAAALFSASFPDAIAVLATVDEEDVLRMRFFQTGSSVEEYVTEPGKAIGEDLPPSGGNITKLATVFGLSDADTLAELPALLAAGKYDDALGFGEAKERHGEIAHLLDLPAASVGVGYESLERGLLPDEVEGASLRHFPTDSGFADSGLKLRQYALFHPAAGETDGQIAARFLPDVISWEDDFLQEAIPVLGTAAEIRAQFSRVFAGRVDGSDGNWLSLLDEEYDLLEADLGTFDQPIESTHLFALSQDIPTALLSRLCEGTPWAVWSYETKQVVSRPTSEAPQERRSGTPS